MKAESIARAELEKRVESLERDLTRAGQESRAQSARAASLQRQLDAGGSGRSGGGALDGFEGVSEAVATADIMALKAKATQLVGRLRQEKTARLKAERKTQKVAGKVRKEKTTDRLCIWKWQQQQQQQYRYSPFCSGDFEMCV